MEEPWARAPQVSCGPGAVVTIPWGGGWHMASVQEERCGCCAWGKDLVDQSKAHWDWDWSNTGDKGDPQVSVVGGVRSASGKDHWLLPGSRLLKSLDWTGPMKNKTNLPLEVLAWLDVVFEWTGYFGCVKTMKYLFLRRKTTNTNFNYQFLRTKRKRMNIKIASVKTSTRGQPEDFSEQKDHIPHLYPLPMNALWDELTQIPKCWYIHCTSYP